MIPHEVGTIAELICPGWADGDDLTLNEVLEAAYRLYHAGYRCSYAKCASAEIERLRFALRTVLGDAEHGQKETWDERCRIGRDALNGPTRSE